MARAINLKRFERKIVVRQLRPNDWQDVVALQQRCFPGMDTWSRDEFESQLATFPEGQIGVEYQGKLVASSSSLILDFEEYKEWDTLDAISDFGRIRNHMPAGSSADRSVRGAVLTGGVRPAAAPAVRHGVRLRHSVGGPRGRC